MTTFSHILYHAQCADGFAAALAAWKVLGNEAEYIPVRHGDPPPLLPSKCRLAILDFSYSRPVLLELAEFCEALLVLDHHKSAQQELSDLPFAHFDQDKSGCHMAWNYWHPDCPQPDLFAYVEDRDLWRWALPESRSVSLALQTYPMEFSVWDQLEVTQLQREGQALLRFQKQNVERACSRVYWAEVAGHRVPTVNSCLFQSEIGEQLCLDHPEASFVGVYYLNQKGLQAWSLRSRGEFDVSLVAQQFGGGGHRNAAGFAVNGSLGPLE